MPPKGELNLRDSNRVLGVGGCRKMSNRPEWGPPIREGERGDGRMRAAFSQTKEVHSACTMIHKVLEGGCTRVSNSG